MNALVVEDSPQIAERLVELLKDKAARAEIVSLLERSGWAVIPQPSGFHLIQAISGVIEGHQSWLRPSMIVIDARSAQAAGRGAGRYWP